MSRADERAFRRVLDHIDDEVSFEPGYYNEAYLSRRIAARMRRQDAANHDEYLAVLRRNPAEKRALLDALTINVTGFFRNPEMWAALRPVVRELTDGRGRADVWSAPCADGREPYSLVMLAADDAAARAGALDVLATDISEAALTAAREGVYETTRTTDIGEELAPLEAYEPYVARDGDRFRVREKIKRRVTFETHDLVTDGRRGPVDLAFCRNLLIYIDAEHKSTVFDTVAGSVAVGGYLVIGKTETVPPGRRDAFEAVDKRCRVYRKVAEIDAD